MTDKFQPPFPIPAATVDETAPREIKCWAKRAPTEPRATVAFVIEAFRNALNEVKA